MLIALILRVGLSVPPTTAAPSPVIRAAVAEAAVIWAPYGVAIDTAAPDDCAGNGRTVLTVVPVIVAGARQPAATPASIGRLGAIAFTASGEPEPAITVFLSDIARLIGGVHVLGAREWQWPAALREEIFGRVLGRVLAHEIGHYLLRSRGHADSGLMRSLQSADDLVAPSRHRLGLTPAESTRLEAGR